ncbi:MAG: DUF402 domain-containing protein [Defluviitaleaceae bacterium]|nr:DUF402 domain-containing protein [Defluviitaleaceae bacterium]
MPPFPTLTRRRFIPNESIPLNDEIIRADGEIILTKWNVLHPVHDFDNGRSCYFLKKGFKLSRFYRGDKPLDYIYCDMIDAEPAGGGYIINDLLIDVLVYDSGFVKVVDVGEVSDALDDGLISVDMAKKALRLLDNLLETIYSGRFRELSQFLE